MDTLYTMIISTNIKNGQPQFSQEQKKLISNFCTNKEGKNLYIAFSEKKFPRTLGQNGFYWKFLEILASEIGDNSEDLHEELKEMFLPQDWRFDEETGQDIKLEKSTTRLSTTEFSKYIDRIIVWAQTYHGFVVPESERSQIIPIDQ